MYQEFLEYLQISKSEFNEIVDSWRSNNIWEKNGDNWLLKNPIWK